MVLYFRVNTLAFKALSGAQDPSKSTFGDAQPLALVVFSTLGTFAILQSFSLKIGNSKIADVGKLMEKFRDTVLEDVGRREASRQEARVRELARKLEIKFGGRPDELRKHFVLATTFGGREAAQVEKEWKEYEAKARAQGVPDATLLALMANRTAQADDGYVRRVLEPDKN